MKKYINSRVVKCSTTKKMENNDEKKRFCIFLLFLIFFLAGINFASAYSPPKYIANPATKECQYYFAGEEDCYNACMNECQGSGWNQSKCFEACADPCHYNKRPAGFTVELGATTNFKDLNESCKVWQDCIDKDGEWDSTTLKCQPKPQEQKSASSDFLAILSAIISLIALIAIIIIYLKIRKMLKQIHAEKK